MSTKFLSPGWRMPRNANQSKFSNYSMSFGGTQYIDAGTGLGDSLGTYTGDASISLWFKANTTTSNDGLFSITPFNGSYFGSLRISLYNNGLYFSGNSTNGSTPVNYKYTSFSDTTNWHHVVCIFKSGDITNSKIYLDGVEQTTTDVGTFASSLSLTGFKTIIGAYRGTVNTFNGSIDGVAIFDYALSQSQVTTLWGGGTSVSNPMALPSTPIAYYPLGTSAWNGNYLAENNAIGDYVFDFSSDYIEVSNSSDFDFGTGNFTISAWFKTSVTPSQHQSILSKQNPENSSEWVLQILSSDNKLCFRTNGVDIVKSTTTVNDGNWNNVIITRVSGVFYLYLNSSQEDTATSSQNLTNSQVLRIGRRYSSYNAYFDGQISNVQIFNTALSGPEVETLYNYGSPIQTLANIPQNSNLKAWYKLDASEVYNSSTTEWSIDNNQNPSAYASSLDFNPSNSDYIQINNGSSLTNGFSELTVSIWANFSSLSTSMGLISKDLVNQRSFDFRFISSSGVNLLVSTDGVNNSQTLYYPTSSITTGVWYNFIGTYDGSKLSIYVNGSLIDDTITLTGSLQNTTSNLYVGTRGYLTSLSFDGKLSNASIWNTALTSTQVTELYNNGTPSNLSNHSGTSNLVSWWKLNNTTTGIEDSKGSNNGTNNGATEYPGFVSKTAGESSGMSQANLVQSDLQTVAPYSKYAMNFLGTDNDYIDCGNSALTAISGGSTALTTPMTLSMWFKLGDSSTSRGLINFGSLNNTYGGFTIRHQSNVLSFLKESTHLITGGYAFTDTSNWHHMTLVYDPTSASNCYLYIDGSDTGVSFVNVGNLSFQNPDLSNRNLIIGAYYGLADTFTGELSNFSTWNTGLTSAQVTEIYNEGVPSNLNNHSAYSNLVSWWQLGENSSFTGDWIFADEKGTNNGDGQNMTEANLTNGVGTTANGVSSGMSEGNLVGDAPYSTANALSSGMSVESRVTGSGNTP